MLRRVVTALVLTALLLGSLSAANPWWFGGLLSLLLLAGAWEWPALAGLHSLAARLTFVAMIVAIAAAARHWLWTDEHFLAAMQCTLFLWVLALLWLLLAPQWQNRVAILLAGIAVLVPAWMALLRVASHWQDGMRWTLLILALPVAMDTGGLFAGRAFGRFKLAPRVSPGKTWEGVLGGLALVVVLAWFTRSWISHAPWLYVALCLGSAAWSVVGDLTESMFKRAAGLKDSGTLFPGHGGALDRIDSITAAAPIMTLGLIWLGAGS